MTDKRTCLRCGSPLVSAGDGALCPVCLINSALEESTAPGTLRPEHGGSAVIELTVQPKQIGPYTIIDTLGQGGMGVVYLAEQMAPIRRRVALKLIRVGRESHQVIARFDAERQALALMDHPNIASVFDAGSTEDGRPYFVMEYVPGLPITEFCDAHRLSTRVRLELFQQVCSAVQHAHQKGIIHRDLKPSNVLVMDQDGRPSPKVIDFGVARATEQRLRERSLLTEQGVLIGTPEYMSPEQAGPNADHVDTRTDIYSLGVLLYELLVGGLPFTSAELRRAGLAEIHRIVRESEPRKPSTKLGELGALASGVADKRQTTVSTLARELRGDLDWIALKAIEKEPERRYASASELSADISRHFEHEPVEAGPPTASYRMRKFVLKHRGAVAVVAITFLVAGLVVITAMYARAERSRQEATRQTVIATESLVKARTSLSEATQKIEDLKRAYDPASPAARSMSERGQEDLQLALNAIAQTLQSHDVDLKNLQRDVAPPGPVSSTCRPEDAAIKQALSSWAQAYSTRQVDAVRNVQPLSTQEAKDLQAMLGQVTDYRVTVDSESCVFSSDGRTVKVSAHRIETTLHDNSVTRSSGLVFFSMSKQGRDWKIVKIQPIR